MIAIHPWPLLPSPPLPPDVAPRSELAPALTMLRLSVPLFGNMGHCRVVFGDYRERVWV